MILVSLSLSSNGLYLDTDILANGEEISANGNR